MELDPSHVNAQVSLGIAALRDRDKAATRAPMEKAVVLEARNPLARRTLGQLLLMEHETAAALTHLRAAAEVAADDPINLFSFGQAMLTTEGSQPRRGRCAVQAGVAAGARRRAGERINNQQRRLADRVMRSKAEGMPRRHAVET